MPEYIDEIPELDDIIAVVQQYHKSVKINFEGCDCYIRAYEQDDSIAFDFSFCDEHGADPELKQMLISHLKGA